MKNAAKQVLYAGIILFFLWEISRFRGNWQSGTTSVFYGIHGPAHEAGHAVARLLRLPETAVILAGPVFQELAPVAAGVYFIFRRDFAGAGFCLGWLGFATLEMASYMYDASARNLNLVIPFGQAGADAHDFGNLFSMWGCLRHCCRIGECFAVLGYGMVFLSMALILLIWIYSFFPADEKQNTGEV